MPDFANIFTTFVQPHLAFFATTLLFMVMGQVSKTSIFPKNGWLTRKPIWFFWWGRKTLPLHPILGGFLLGLMWHHPEPGINTIPAAMTYFAVAGALSVWAYEFLKGLAKKQGIDLSLPGEEDDPDPLGGLGTDESEKK